MHRGYPRQKSDDMDPQTGPVRASVLLTNRNSDKCIPAMEKRSLLPHSASSPTTMALVAPASILKSDKQLKDMKKHNRRISTDSTATTTSQSRVVTFDTSLPSMSSTSFHRAFDAETAALRSLKNRRTSLPVNTHGEAAPSGNISEARGLVVDMLANRDLPPNVTSCLKAVAQLLNTQSTSVNNFNFSEFGFPRIVENPYSGEQILVTAASKPRVSNITFSTVTSATGLPTIAAEPSRPRSSSYWKPHSDSQSTLHLNSVPHGDTASAAALPSPSPSGSKVPNGFCRCESLPANDLSTTEEASAATAGSSEGHGPQAKHSPPTTLEGACTGQQSSLHNQHHHQHHHHHARVTPEPDREAAATTTIAVSPGISPSTSASAVGVVGAVPYSGNNGTCKSPGTPSTRVVAFSFSKDDVVEREAFIDEEEEDFATNPMETAASIKVADGTAFELDDLKHDTTLKLVNEWGFPIFHVNERHRFTILTRMTWAVFNETDIFRIFKLPPQKFFNFFHALEMGYWEIPYHNRIHAADVLHGCYYLTCHPVHAFTGRPSGDYSTFEGNPMPVSASMSSLELMALFTAAAMHDYDHPGRTNAFLVASEDKKAIMYNDRSVLENHHAAESWRLLCQRDNNFIENLDSAETKRFRYLVLEYILATDLKQHFDIIMQFNDKASDMDLTNEADRVLVSQALIKFADINSPAKPYPLHRQWTERICQEFYEQGDEEKARQMPLSPYMDRNEPDVAKLQDSFIAHIVNPLAVALNEAGLLPVLPGLEESELIINLKHNHQRWLMEIEENAATLEDLDNPAEGEIEVGFSVSQTLPTGQSSSGHLTMQALPEEEGENSSSTSSLAMHSNNNDNCSSPLGQREDDDFGAPIAKKQSHGPMGNGSVHPPPLVASIEVGAPPPPTNYVPKLEGISAPSPVSSPLGRFEKRFGISRRYLASVLKYFPSSKSSSSAASSPSSTSSHHQSNNIHSAECSVTSRSAGGNSSQSATSTPKTLVKKAKRSLSLSKRK